MHCPQPHISSSPSAATAVAAISAAFDLKPAKRRGSYNCGRCGLPKKGHVCQVSPGSTSTSTSTPTSTSAATTTETSSSAARPPHPHPARQPYSHLRRALDIDDIDIRCDLPEFDLDVYNSPFPGRGPDSDSEIVSGGLPVGCLWEILRRLPPAGLLTAGRFCKGWRETTKRLWRAVEKLTLMVPPRTQLRFIGSVLQKCPSLITLSPKVESDVDATILACIAFSCPNLESMEISTSDAAVNRITGDELGSFVADKRCLVRLKMEGCSNFGSFILSSSSLSTLGFLIFILFLRRGLRMLSLVLGSEITDASVAAIASSY